MNHQAPDVIGEVIGYRAWRVIAPDWGPPELRSIFTETVWPAGAWLVGDCQWGKDGPVPHEDCRECGIYAARDRGHLVTQGYNRSYGIVAIGEVALAGDVIPGTRGWRAERGRPVRLWVPYEHWSLVKPLRVTYGVPVGLSNVLKRGGPDANRA